MGCEGRTRSNWNVRGELRVRERIVDVVPATLTRGRVRETLAARCTPGSGAVRVAQTKHDQTEIEEGIAPHRKSCSAHHW